MIDEKCENCYYFQPEGRYAHRINLDGKLECIGLSEWNTCRRFPKSIQKEPDDWCGEWKERLNA